MLTAYLIIACFASAFAAQTETNSVIKVTLFGLFWPVLLLIILFYGIVSRR